MLILFETTYLATGQIQSPDDISLNGEQIVDEAEFFRAAAMTFFPRGNVKVEFDFTVHYSFASTVLAEVFLLTLPSQVPMTNADNGVLQCVCGEATPATSQTVYMSGAVLRSARVVRQVGTSIDVRYSFVGPGFTSSVPGSGLPTYPNPNEIVQVYRRGKIAIPNGATSVAVVFSSQLPGLPGADPYCWISGPSGSAFFECWTDTDTVTTLGFTAALGAAAPNGNYFLNYAVFM
jgi:hypothetical protein